MSETPQSQDEDALRIVDRKINRHEMDDHIFDLKKYGLKPKVIAAALGKRTQNVYRAISNPPKKGYFTMERIADLIAYCRRENKPDIADRILEIQDRYFDIKVPPPSYMHPLSDFLSPETEELWQFSRVPLELESLKYREKMKKMIADPGVRMVYFTLENSAKRMRGFLSSCEQPPRNVVLINTNSISLSPDYLIRFEAGKPEGQPAIFRSEGDKKKQLEYAYDDIAALNEIVASDMRALLETVDLMGFDFRLRKNPSGTYGGGDYPTFEVIDVM